MDSEHRGPREGVSPHAEIEHAVEHAAHLLPSQGPITVFVHHNTLHAFEEMPFDEAVVVGGLLYDCRPYLDESRYRQLLKNGQFDTEDLSAVLIDDLGDDADRFVGFMGTRYQLRLAMLEHPLLAGPEAEVRWSLAESDALTRFRRETPPEARARSIASTRRWVLEDVSRAEAGGPIAEGLEDLMASLNRAFGIVPDPSWGEATWESYTLHLLWRLCRRRVDEPRESSVRAEGDAESIERRRRRMAADLLVNEVLVRFCAAFVDQGFAHWSLPGRERGFLNAFRSLYGRWAPRPPWLAGLPEELERLQRERLGPVDSIADSLARRGVDPHDCDAFITKSLLTLRGWAGMLWQLETNAEWVVHQAPKGTLLEFLAVRLILDRLAEAFVERHHAGPLGIGATETEVRRGRESARASLGEGRSLQEAYRLFQLAQVRGWEPVELARMSPREWALLAHELDAFDGLERRRIYHLAYERRFYTRSLDAVIAHGRRAAQVAAREPAEMRRESRPPLETPPLETPPVETLPVETLPVETLPQPSRSHETTAREERTGTRPSAAAEAVAAAGGDGPARPAYQIVTCIDDREESYRRHLEEVDPDCETYGVAGFFGVAMYYRGASEAHFRPLCPVNIKPSHYVQEEPVYSFAESSRRQADTRRALGRFTHRFHLGTRTVLAGWIAGLLGSLATFPLVMRVLMPRTTAQLRRRFGSIMQTSFTQLRLERISRRPGPTDESLGFSIEEMADIVEGTLRAIGLTDRFASLVVITGHGSSSLNNPHAAAYDCGACGGGRGGANARAFAQMANDWRVRRIVERRGLPIPDHVRFVGAYHNTCDDDVTYYDLDRLPASHRGVFERCRRATDEVRKRNAHERCRRFESADLASDPASALRHVEGRAEDLSQVRPELGHATNALCFVGRRSMTRGLFLDRRAFLTSYDPTQDDDRSTILARLLSAVVPVCGGINLEYFFSYVDSLGYGCGTKLPHNVTSLLGVMDGAASDLRPGLPWQMVEIHEPIRLLFVIETTPAAMESIMDANPVIGRMVRHEWVRVATVDPHDRTVHLFSRGAFRPYRALNDVLPVVPASVTWYGGHREHLAFATIAAGSERAVGKGQAVSDIEGEVLR